MHRVTWCALALVILPRIGAAQDSSHWGIVGSATPRWKTPAQLAQLIDGTVDIQGTDFAIGLARGRSRSGDWGVSFIHKKVKDGSRIDTVEEDCRPLNGCFKDGEVLTTRGVAINGLELHKFIPFVRIRDRVQIGMNLAGGFGTFTGSVEKSEFSQEFISFDQASQRPIARQQQTVSTEPARELFEISTMPLFKLQASVAFIASPALKVRVQGGLDFPGYEVVSISAVYLIGGK